MKKHIYLCQIFAIVLVVSVTGCSYVNVHYETAESSSETPVGTPGVMLASPEEEAAAPLDETEALPSEKSEEESNLEPDIQHEIPGTAQETYRGVMQKTLPYDCLLKGNDPVNQNIAEITAEVLEACRQGKDPNNLLPASNIAYEPYPLETVRDNPDANEIGAILRKADVDEDGTIRFGIDLGEGWFMSLPIRIGGFGDNWQAFFTGVSYSRKSGMESNGLEGDREPDESVICLDISGDGVEDTIRIDITADREIEHQERLTVTDGTDNRAYSCTTDEFVPVIRDRFINELEVYQDENNLYDYRYSFGFDENHLLKINQTDLESIVQYTEVVFGDEAHFIVRDDRVFVTYACQTGWNETVAMIEVPLSVSGSGFAVSDPTLRENADLFSEIADRKAQPPVSSNDFTFQRYKNGWLVTEYRGKEANLTIPAEFDGLPVVGVGTQCFFLNQELYSVELPAVCEVGIHCFSSSSLAVLSAPKLISVGMDAFSNCERLTEVTLEQTEVFSLGAFENCCNLKDICIPEARFIGIYAFFHTAVQTIDLPQLQHLDNEAFSNCHSLNSVRIPAVRVMNGNPFYVCTDVEIHTSIDNDCMAAYEQEAARRGYGVSITYE